MQHKRNNIKEEIKPTSRLSAAAFSVISESLLSQRLLNKT